MAKTAVQVEPVDLTTINFRPSMGMERLEELAALQEPQQAALQEQIDAANAKLPALLDKSVDLDRKIYVQAEDERSPLVATLGAIDRVIASHERGIKADEEKQHELDRAGIQIRSAISQINAAEWQKERDAKAQAERDAVAAAKAEKARQFQADKLAQAEAKRKTARAFADRRYNEPL